jgi:hypothetical protein
LAKSPSSSMKPDSDSVFGTAKNMGQLVLGESFPGRESQHLGIGLAKRVQRSEYGA